MSDESIGLRLVAEHIFRVQGYMGRSIAILSGRSVAHDKSKYSDAEKDLVTGKPKLDKLDYTKPEYKEALAEVESALVHHYSRNRHHPEYFGVDGVLGMSLFDLLEMLCDWKAAGEMSKGGSIEQSIDFNAKRYNLPTELVRILWNTAVEMGMVVVPEKV